MATTDLAPLSVLDELASAARVAFLVEMDHFIHQKYEFRLQCVRYLASQGWRWFGEEIDWRLGERFDRFLATGDQSLLAPIEDPPWYTAGILAGPAVRHPAAAMAAEQARFFQALRQSVPPVRWFGFDVGATDTDYLELANAADSYEELRPAMALREHKMKRRVADVFESAPGEKFALMAGSLHLMKNDHLVAAPVGAGPGGDTETSLGHYVSQQFDTNVLSIWLLHGQGTSASPWLPQPGTLKPAPRTLNKQLLRRYDRPVLITTGNDTRRRRITHMHNQVMTCRLPQQADAIIFAPTVSPII